MVGTPNVVRYHTASREAFPWIIDAGIRNCRLIAGSTSWSQHAWDNGDDAHTGPSGSSTSKTRGDALVAWLLETVETDFGSMQRYQAYGIRHILWWARSVLTGNAVADHFDHVHVDFWPRGAGDPPCDGGELRVVYPDGSLEHAFALYPVIEIKEDDDMAFLPIEFGMGGIEDPKRSDVAVIQGLLKRAYSAKLEEDGQYGDKMAAEIVRLGINADSKGHIVTGSMYLRMLDKAYGVQSGLSQNQADQRYVKKGSTITLT